jgi:hypothetical protein
MGLIGAYLREAFEAEGCPVCRIIQRFEEGEMGTILYEHVNDPEVRERFKASLGLCPYHAWRLFEIASSNPLYDSLGVAVIYEHMLGTYLKSFEGGISEGKCHLCSLVEDKEKLTIAAIAGEIETLLPIYRDSKAVICKRHYELLLEELESRNPSFVEPLKEIQREKLENLKGLLERFIENSDYRSENGPRDEEGDRPRLLLR